jgi:hypothetical protein
MFTTVTAQDKVDEIIDEGIERNTESKASQGRIDNIAEQTDDVVARYKKELKVIDGLKVYNSLLQKQLDDQAAQIANLKNSVDEVAVIQRQVTPLMVRMIEGLNQYIQLDVPFLMSERNERVERLRETIERADVSAAEKFRAVLEAYQIESEYGRTIEAYSGSLDVGGKTREVDFLKIGRVALLYQTPLGDINGAWDQANRQWVELKAADYKNHISNGLKIARKQVAPDILMIPVNAAEDM